MRTFHPKEFYNFILDNNVVGFFEKPVKLKSGRYSHWYVNWRNIAEDVFLIDQLGEFIIRFTEDLNLKPNCFYGVPEGATKIGLITQYKWAKRSPNYGPGSHVLPMGRGKPKNHGMLKDKYFGGVPKGKVIVIEDVTTTGESLIKTIDYLMEVGVSIISAFSLTDRMEIGRDGKSVQEAIESKGIKYYALSNAFDLLPLAYKKLNPPAYIEDMIEKEFKNHCVRRLKIR